MRELQTIKELGFNLLRKHAKIEPQRWYYHCDRLGLIVWQDIVNGGSAYNLWFVTYLTNVLQPLVRRLPDAERFWGLLSRGKASSRETYRKELQATVEALRCHPCIGCWVPFNEAGASLMRPGQCRPSARWTIPALWTRPAVGMIRAAEMCAPSTTISIRCM